MFGKLARAVKGLFCDTQSETPQGLTEEQIQTEFKKRYHHFKLLLTANKKALELMTEMEEALNGRRTFGMAFIRAHSTGVSVNVYKIVEHLNAIAPGKYAELYNRIKDIQRRIGECLASSCTLETSPELVLPLDQAGRDQADLVGGKMAGLGEIVRRTGLPVPPGFAITARAYHRLIEHNDLKDEIYRLLQTAGPDDQRNLLILSSQIRNKITEAELPSDVSKAILGAYADLCRKVGREASVSLRSSALGEDEAGQTFAGQFSSKLNVGPEDILQSYKEIIASKYSPQAMTYRLNRGIPDEDVAMCVGVMAMVDAVAGGVIYSRNPLDIRDDSIHIHSAFGLPKSVVDGTVGTDEFVFERERPPRLTARHIREKDQAFLCLPGEGVCRTETSGERALLPSITDDQALALAEATITLEAMYGAPVDVEWAIDASGGLEFLQCRELVQLPSQTGGGSDRVYGTPLVSGGVTASPGAGFGPVFVVRREADLLQFPRGAVLVAVEAPPRYASIIDRAAAIVTEKGGAAGHLANVAREFRVPSIMGLAGATRLLAPGAEVTVDADGRAIYPGRLEELLAEAEAQRQPAPERVTPMHAILRRVMDQITPLSLIDPNAPEFAPENCRTLHDVTRFCHEKSVTEMFNFGQEFHFSKRAAKQLKYKGTAMKWWFINLDDGFVGDVPGKYVKLEEICSIPVGALWDGIIAIPWQGPPPVDGRGLMSIIVQASTNPHLEAASHSSFAERNYFMVSRNYMCLSSRFGFHFCTVETMVGDRPSENYVSFQFKGGAAEYSRRRRRAQFVGEILELQGFGVEVNEDASFARINGGSEEEMLRGLTVIGYMLMHTRQLDMIMHNEPLVQSYKQKILDDLVKVVGQPLHVPPPCPAPATETTA
ncbi:MAG: phosphoenolpyruvate synthase/pyruvate phosphate dikinase [Solidesulfovibrio magneticus str. Maddingley MBC34]|uniref:Phosphoenolpyruvate synthase n=1 Tax=Solidesulfovibrio magneticus str. Maddingley MBC34 TaxID=1206767 RepID=K6GNW7_9BACT|nr:MAG: phosphoenolpyruvate synthase/pyruvate phosphate dikinase [Solidesulfovibrio magneticus str. Maddingley MBC34]